jgi:hypothetical protein
LGTFGFFGRCGFFTVFGGVAGCNSAKTGLGSVVTVAGVEKSGHATRRARIVMNGLMHGDEGFI